MNKIFIIAECGHNANGNMRLNKLMIEEAKLCGADAVKFQLYDADTFKKHSCLKPFGRDEKKT